MAMTLLPADFKDFLKLLNDHEADYLLVGGYAVGYHGYPRATVDLDIWIKRNRANAKKLVTIVKRFGFDIQELNEALFPRIQILPAISWTAWRRDRARMSVPAGYWKIFRSNSPAMDRR